MADHIRITGGAGPEEAAAISAVIASIEAEELVAARVMPKPIHQSQWRKAGRSAQHSAPAKRTQSPDAAPSAGRES